MKQKFFIAITAIAMMFMVTSCGNKIDKLLDKYDKAVTEYEEAIEASGDDFAKMEAASKDFEKKMEELDELKDVQKDMTKEQNERFMEITGRVMATAFSAAAKAEMGNPDLLPADEMGDEDMPEDMEDMPEDMTEE